MLKNPQIFLQKEPEYVISEPRFDVNIQRCLLFGLRDFCIYTRVAPDIRPDIWPFLVSGIRPDSRISVRKNCLALKTEDK